MSTTHHRAKFASIAGVIVTAAFAFTACGADDDAATPEAPEAPDVEISYEITEDTETVEIDGELELEQPTAWVIEEGDGEPIEADTILHILSASVDVENEEVRAHDFDLGGSTLPVSDELAGQFPQVHDIMVGAPLNSDIAFYMPADSLGEGTPAQMDIMHLEDVVPAHATGDEVDDADIDDRLPDVTLDEETQAPVIDTPEGDPPEELVVDTLKQGDGPEVVENAFVTIQYRGIGWSDGEEFDSSWGEDDTGGPVEFELSQLISGWQEGLEGQQVGSQVMMSIPPEQAYGDEDHELQDETLVFVVDIVHSADPVQPEGPDETD